MDWNGINIRYFMMVLKFEICLHSVAIEDIKEQGKTKYDVSDRNDNFLY